MDDDLWSDATPTTPVAPIVQVTFRREDGATFGPMHFPAALDKVIQGAVGPEDEVAVDGGEFRPLREVEELVRFAPGATPTTGQVDQVPPPDRRALLSDEAVARVFATHALHSDTGLVVFEHGPIRKDVYLVDGNPIHVSSNMASELLGEYLVRMGVLSRMELEMAFALLPKFDNHLGDTLIGLGLIDSMTLFRHISDQVRGKLLDLFGWSKGEYRYYAGVTCPQPTFPLGIEVFSIIWAGIDRTLDAEEAEHWIEARREKMLRQGTNPLVDSARLQLPPHAQAALTLAERSEVVSVVAERAAGRGGRRIHAEVFAAIRLGLALGILEIGES